MTYRAITPAQALEAIESLDDCARMNWGVNAEGARETLYRYVMQTGSIASPPLPTMASAGLKHTPGPWVCDEPQPGDRYRNVLDGNDRRFAPAICRLTVAGGQFDRPATESEANARLIAAAPLLLGALIDLLKSCTTPFDIEHAMTLDGPALEKFLRSGATQKRACYDDAWEAIAIATGIRGQRDGA